MSAVNALHEISMEVATALEKCLDVEPGHVAAVFFAVRSSLKGGLDLIHLQKHSTICYFHPETWGRSTQFDGCIFYQMGWETTDGWKRSTPTTEKPRYSWKGGGATC